MHLNRWFGIGAIFVPAIVRKNLTSIPIVPCFPEKFDVVQVLGEEEEWFAQVTSVSERDKTVQVQPLTASARRPGRNLCLRERRQRMSSETVHWNSILQVANGRWHSGTCWEWLSPSLTRNMPIR